MRHVGKQDKPTKMGDGRVLDQRSEREKLTQHQIAMIDEIGKDVSIHT